MKKENGFTLIELIVVIIILGILAAVALPRFVNLQRDSRVAKLNAAKGAVAGAAGLVHAGILARSGVADTAACPGGGGIATNAGTGAGTLCTESGVINTINGYPQALLPPAIGIVSAAGLTSVLSPTIVQLRAEGYDATGGGAVAGSVLTIQVTGGTAAATCSFTYTAPAANAAAIISAPVTTGC